MRICNLCGCGSEAASDAVIVIPQAKWRLIPSWLVGVRLDRCSENLAPGLSRVSPKNPYELRFGTYLTFRSLSGGELLDVSSDALEVAGTRLGFLGGAGWDRTNVLPVMSRALEPTQLLHQFYAALCGTKSL